jgi:glycerophosphoryl diester phosphodiesterase
MKLFVHILVLLSLWWQSDLLAQTNVSLPERGICAHRGANETHPENTLAAFREAVRLGAHMVEFDVQITKDKHLVIMHDKSVDRTTNGKGLVSNLTLSEIRKLDAGSWKSPGFKGEKVPVLKEALAVFPKNIWLNIHLKGNEELGRETAKVLLSSGRIRQGVIACGKKAERGVKSVSKKIMICNMERQSNRELYIQETVKGEYPFIQLLKKRDDSSLEKDISLLKKNKVKINYYFGDSKKDIKKLIGLGIDFILTNKLDQSLKVAEEYGIKRLNQ